MVVNNNTRRPRADSPGKPAAASVSSSSRGSSPAAAAIIATSTSGPSSSSSSPALAMASIRNVFVITRRRSVLCQRILFIVVCWLLWLSLAKLIRLQPGLSYHHDDRGHGLSPDILIAQADGDYSLEGSLTNKKTALAAVTRPSSGDTIEQPSLRTARQATVASTSPSYRPGDIRKSPSATLPQADVDHAGRIQLRVQTATEPGLDSPQAGNEKASGENDKAALLLPPDAAGLTSLPSTSPKPTRPRVVIFDDELAVTDTEAPRSTIKKPQRHKAVNKGDPTFTNNRIRPHLVRELENTTLPGMEAPELTDERQNVEFAPNMMVFETVSLNQVNRFLVSLQDMNEGRTNCLLFDIIHDNTAIVRGAQVHVGLKPTVHTVPLCGLQVIHRTRAKRQGSWKPTFGERSDIPDNVVEDTLTFKLTNADDDQSRPFVRLVIRAYDEGVAWNLKVLSVRQMCDYVDPNQANKCTNIFLVSRVIMAEDGEAYVDHGNEYGFSSRRLTDFTFSRLWTEDVVAAAPLHIWLDSGMHIVLTEARNWDFRGVLFDHPNGTLVDVAMSFQYDLDREQIEQIQSLRGLIKDDTPLGSSGQAGNTSARTTQPLNSEIREISLFSPWWVAIISTTSGGVIENRYLIDNLNDPSLISDTAWIRPGKGYRDMTLSTYGCKAALTVAKTFNMQYVLFDAGWYGDEYNTSSDATKPLTIPKKQELDWHVALRFVRERQLGLFLYVNDLALKQQIHDIVRMFNIWDIRGIKFGFVQIKSGHDKRRLMEYVLLCAKHRLLVNIHDYYRPSGLSRTLPNLVSQEGIRGDEHSPNAIHSLFLPFTRFIAGPADHTYTLQTARLLKMKKTIAHQLALPIALYSPMPHLFWYIDPWSLEKTWDVASPMFTPWKQMPASYADVKVINADPTQLFTVARKTHTGDWFIASINLAPITFNLSLTFLTDDIKYTAVIIMEDESKPFENVVIHENVVSQFSHLLVTCGGSSGFLAWLNPVKSGIS